MNKKQQKRKARFIGYAAVSIDGRISISKRSMPDWTSEEDWRFFQGELSKTDAVIVGRNTYAAAAPRLRKRNAFVLSNRLSKAVRRGSVTFINPSKIDLDELFIGYKRVAVLGGANVYSDMLKRGLLDELYVTIEPLIFGRGQSLFVEGEAPFQLELKSAKRLNKRGSLLLHYHVLESKR
jgi:dihydrofolate reductase